MTWRTALAAGVAAAGLVLTPAVAVAHEVDPSVLTVIDDVTPSVAGVEVQVATSVTTQLVAANRTDDVLEVLDDHGEPFLRIGPQGVAANLSSAAWWTTNQPFGGSPPPGVEVGEGVEARWATVSTQPSWGWFDHRLHPEPIAALGEGRTPRFEIPMRLGTTEVRVRGHLEPRTSVLRFASQLRSPARPAAGLEVQLLEGRAPGLLLRSDRSDEVLVRGADGEAFARLGPGGASVNRRSLVWVFTQQARGDDPSDVVVDPQAPPDWHSLGSSASLAWIDPRARVEQEPREAGEVAQRAWSIPVEVGGETVQIEGTSTASLEPLPRSQEAANEAEEDRSDWLVLLVVAAPLVVVAAAVAGLRSRRA